MTHSHEDGPSISEEDFEDILEAVPALTLVRPFVATAKGCAWFTALGTPLDEDMYTAARHYLDALGFPDVEPLPLDSWEDASDAAVSLDWDTSAWDAEEQLRAALTQSCFDRLGEEALEVAATYVTSEVTPAINLGAKAAARTWRVRDGALVNAAVGGAVQTCHLALLSLLAGEASESHPFTAKFELYERGRWPVAIAGSSFNLF